MSNVKDPQAPAAAEPQTSPIAYVKLNSSLGVILGVVVPKMFQVKLKDIVLTAYGEQCPFISIVSYDPEIEKVEDVVKSIVGNGRDLVLLDANDFFSPAEPPSDLPTGTIPEGDENGEDDDEDEELANEEDGNTESNVDINTASI